MPDRTTVLDAVTKHLQAQLEAVEGMARLAADEATSDESRAENKYDTRSLEASYLARGQAERVGALRSAVAAAQRTPREPRDADAPVGVGSIVELLDEAERARWVLLLPTGGGAAVPVGDGEVLLVTPDSPLGRALLGCAEGDDVEVPTKGATRTYEVVTVR